MLLQPIQANTENVSKYTCPERTLYAAVLERAFRDLKDVKEKYYRRDAIAWFDDYFLKDKAKRRNEHQADLYISFLNCVEYLELSFRELMTLKKEVFKARKLEAYLTKKELSKWTK